MLRDRAPWLDLFQSAGQCRAECLRGCDGSTGTYATRLCICGCHTKRAAA